MFDTLYQEFIYKRTYSRWLDSKENRRESWEETVNRYKAFMIEKVPKSKKHEFEKACEHILSLDIMPSMRALWSAGKALERENLCCYNCAYLIVNSIKSFSEIMYILMCGTGVGFSVERQHINNLPQIPILKEVDKEIIFNDSKLGWAKGFFEYLSELWKGNIFRYNLDKIRPQGSILKTFGGRASGPEPLKQLLDFTLKVFREAEGRKLNSLECYDIVCYIANVVVAGGTRRSATLSLSNLSDNRLALCKEGQFWETAPQRQLSNNSIAYTEKPDCLTFMEEWIKLARSGAGERGIFNREGADYIVKQTGRRTPGYEWGCNPCSEIILRPQEFCNLTEVIIRTNDSLDTLKKKVRLATILGVVQSTFTDFKFISRDWKKNCEEERLLGVSLTGLRDHEVLSKQSSKSSVWLIEMKQVAIGTAEEWSRALEINMPTAITCVKPSGTVSQLVNSASGLHPRYSPFYIRRVRVSSNDPIAKLMVDSGVPYKPEVGQQKETCTTVVFEFPIKSPENAIFRDEAKAIDQLNYWKMIQTSWCEHKPSCTIYVKQNEWVEVGNWVYKNWLYVSGISFLPYDGGVYRLAPYEEITEDKYNELTASFPKVDFNKISDYEKQDMTVGGVEYTCTGNSCEL